MARSLTNRRSHDTSEESVPDDICLKWTTISNVECDEITTRPEELGFLQTSVARSSLAVSPEHRRETRSLSGRTIGDLLAAGPVSII